VQEGERGLLDFEAFRLQVGASTRTVRAALQSLNLEPIPLMHDRREKRYRAEWVSMVKEWIVAHTGAATE